MALDDFSPDNEVFELDPDWYDEISGRLAGVILDVLEERGEIKDADAYTVDSVRIDIETHQQDNSAKITLTKVE